MVVGTGHVVREPNPIFQLFVGPCVISMKVVSLEREMSGESENAYFKVFAWGHLHENGR